MSGITSKQPTQGVSSEWAVAFTPAAKQLKLDETICKKYNDSLKCTNTSNFNKEDKSNVYVAWNDGIVVSSDKGRLYSSDFGSCIAVLMRSQENNNPSQLGMVHVMGEDGVEVVEEKLQEIADQTHDAFIDVFISGGKNSVPASKVNYNNILDRIKKFNEPKSRAIIRDDKFGIIDNLNSPLEANGKVYKRSVGISYAGFNSENNPYLEIDADVIDYKGDLNALKPYQLV